MNAVFESQEHVPAEPVMVVVADADRETKAVEVEEERRRVEEKHDEKRL
jgi:hypothetical protein